MESLAKIMHLKIGLKCSLSLKSDNYLLDYA